MTTEKTADKKTAKKTQAKTAEDFFAGYATLVELGKANMDAAMKSGAIFAQGMEELNSMVFAMTRTNVEESLKLSKTLMACKTPEEFFEVQNDVAKTSYEKALDEGRKISDITAKLAEKAGQPIAERVTASVEVLSKSIAA